MTIGVDVGGSNIRAGVKLNGAITERRHAPLENKDSLSSTVSQIIDNIRRLMKPTIKGIGIAVPSVVDVEKGIVYNAVNITSWERVELKDILQNTFEVPVKVNNDANCFALGEYYYGAANSHSAVVGLVLGTGVGCGIITNNQLYNGSNCGAGEIGYLPYLDHDMEYYCSSNFFTVMHKVGAYETHLQALGGDTQALKIWSEFGVHIGNIVKAIVYAYDPEVIVIGGSIAKAFPFFESTMRAEVFRKFHYPESIKRLKIVQSVNDNITLLGAASLIEGSVLHN